MCITLIYDPEISGHHAEYIEHLAQYISNNNIGDEFIFVVNPDFLQIFGNIVQMTKENKNTHWLYLSQKEYEKVSINNLFIRSFKNYSLVQKYAKQVNADRVLIMHINNFQPAFWFLTPKYSVSGILFLQFYRQSKKTLKDKIKYSRKYFTSRLFAKNKSLKSIFVLNDEKSVKYMNVEFCTNIFKLLPDPTPQLKAIENFDIHSYYNIETHKKIFLHLGALDERKGTLEILEAIPTIQEKKEEICIVIAGKCDSIFKKKIRDKIDFFSNSNVQIVWIDSFISNELMKTLFDQCFCVLLPYKMPEASSGIFGHAKIANKRIIGNSQGLLGEMINSYELGITIEVIDGKAIGNAMLDSLTIEKRLVMNDIMSNTPYAFAKIVLENIK